MIFHLSYDFNNNPSGNLSGKSVNACTPREICTVRYNDLDVVVGMCLELCKQFESSDDQVFPVIFLGKMDLSSAFRVLPLKIKCFCWLIFKAEDPDDGIVKYFVEKCLPFGASISCVHYQRFSNSLKHLLEYRTGKKGRRVTNYLDDFLFLTLKKLICNDMIEQFIKLCQELNVPVAFKKTEWASTMLVFLGILLNGQSLTLSIPVEKQQKALKFLHEITSKKRVTIKQLQTLTGYLNFLTKAIVPGRTFTCRMYAKYTNIKGAMTNKGRPKQYYHILLDSEFRLDCEIWKTFLEHYSDLSLCRPMIDLDTQVTAKQLKLYSDASKNTCLGMGVVFNTQWQFAQWEPGFIEKYQPSIEYLELLVVVSAILTWGDQLANLRLILFCDNMAVVNMIYNGMVSSCENCMFLLRLLTLNNLVHNRRTFARYVKSEENYLSDSLSHLQFKCFWRLAPQDMCKYPSPISPLIWPPSKIWIKKSK